MDRFYEMIQNCVLSSCARLFARRVVGVAGGVEGAFGSGFRCRGARRRAGAVVDRLLLRRRQREELVVATVFCRYFFSAGFLYDSLKIIYRFKSREPVTNDDVDIEGLRKVVGG